MHPLIGDEPPENLIQLSFIIIHRSDLLFCYPYNPLSFRIHLFHLIHSIDEVPVMSSHCKEREDRQVICHPSISLQLNARYSL